MHKPKTQATPSAKIEVYEPSEILGTELSIIPQLGTIFKQFTGMNHDYEYYQSPFTPSGGNNQNVPQRVENADNQEFETITSGDVEKLEQAFIADIPTEPAGNYITSSNMLSQTTENLNAIPSMDNQHFFSDNEIFPVSPTQIPMPTAPRRRRKSSRRSDSSKSDSTIIKGKTPYNFIGAIPDKPFTPFNPLPYYRRNNGLTFKNFKQLINADPHVTFEMNKKFTSNMYEPAVNKKFNYSGNMQSSSGGNAGGNKTLSQGNFALCPYCELSRENLTNNCEKMFYKRNDSNYLHHMIQYHGIFSNGELVKDPQVRGWASTQKDKQLVEVVQCPYCGELISLKKFKPENRMEHRLLKYLRHVKEKHKTGKNLQIMHQHQFSTSS